jgi:pimeloyl-ACP methyl ester carboxylesterase
VTPPASSEGQDLQFSSHYDRRLLHHVGHCPSAEDPDAVARAIEEVLSLSTPN